MRRGHAAGRYGDARTRCKSNSTSAKALAAVVLFLIPIRPIVCPYGSRPPHMPPIMASQSWFDQTAALPDPGNPPFGQHRPYRASHLIGQRHCDQHSGLRSSIRASHDPVRAPFREAHWMTAMAPMMSSRRISRWPIFEVWPSRCFPPVECWTGTSPSQAAKSRPRLKVSSAEQTLPCHRRDRPYSRHGLQRRRVSLRAGLAAKDFLQVR